MITLYKLDARKVMREWVIEENYEDNTLHIYSGVQHGQFHETVIDITTNQSGRTSDEQLDLEYDSRVAKQIRTGYCETEIEARNQPKFKAMKGKVYTDFKHKVKLDSSIVQPKLNGIRCTVHKVSEQVLEFWSYGRIEYTTLQHIERQLKSQMEVGDILDGELYVHGVHLQTINSWIKRKQTNTLRIEYHIFDTVDYKLGWLKRQLPIVEDTHVKVVEYQTVTTHKQIEDARLFYVRKGYEGIVIRDTSVPYECRKGYAILKYKLFDTAEFLIKEVVAPSKGEDKGCAIFVCFLDDLSSTFRTVPIGSKAKRRKMYKNKESYPGLMATVKYAGLSIDGVPTPNPVTEIVDRIGQGDL